MKAEIVAARCAASETELFHCRLKRAEVAICGWRDVNGKAFAEYRFRSSNGKSLRYPDVSAGEPEMHIGHIGYSGGGMSQFAFARGGYEYAAYSKMVRTGFEPGGTNDPEFTAGVLVLRDKKLVKDYVCVDPPDANVDTQLASKFIKDGKAVEENLWPE